MASTANAKVEGANTVTSATLSRELWIKIAKQVGASFFFGVASILIMTVNKTVLTTYNFRAFQVVGLGQIVTIVVLLWALKMLKLVSFPDLSWSQLKRIFPLPIFYFFNLVLGLGGTQKTNLPMFTVLRRFTLIFVSVGQIYMFNKYETTQVNFSLILMIVGAFVAAYRDLTFDLIGYTYVTLNNVATAANNLYAKKKLSGDMGNVELMYYNSLVAFVPALVLAAATGELRTAYEYPNWTSAGFLVNFFLSCIMGAVLMYSVTLCQQLTSALTYTVVGGIKNVVVTYIGMYVGGDYMFELYNFIGIHVSVAANLLYTFFKFKEEQAAKKQKEQDLASSETKA
ncbi:hypothetical protein EMCRGX_G014637 [Ephydatia muelleri]